jgi:hypothetical protein
LFAAYPLLSGKSVLGCVQCKQLVPNCATHMKKVHGSAPISLTELEAFNQTHNIDSHWKPESRVPFEFPIPLLPLVDGFQCTGCSRCFVHPKSAKCCAPLLHPLNPVKLHLVTYGTGYREIAVRVLQWRAVVSSPVPEDDERSANLLKANRVISKHLMLPLPLISETSAFFRKLNWFQEDGELALVWSAQLHKYFDAPIGVPSEWGRNLSDMFVKMLEWFESVNPWYRLEVSGSRTLQMNSKRKYAATFVRIVNFALNVSRKPVRLSEKWTLGFPFQLAENIIRQLNESSLVNVIQELMTETIVSKNIGVIDAILRVESLARQDPTRPSLKDPRDIQYLPSRIMKLFRVQVLAYSAYRANHKIWGDLGEYIAEEALAESVEENMDSEDDNLSDSASQDFENVVTQNPSPTDSPFADSNELIVKHIRESLRYLDAVKEFPIHTLRNVKNLSRVYAGRLDERIVVTEDIRVILYNGKEIDLRKLSAVYMSFQKRAEDLINELSLGVDTSLDIEDLIDNYHDSQICHKRDGVERAILLAIAEDSSRVVSISDEEIYFKADFSSKYLKKFDELQSVLAVLIHLGGGMPGRGAELVKLRFCTHSGRRNVHLFRKNVFIDPETTKTSWSRGDPSIYRFLDEQISVLLMRSLVFLRPVAHMLATQLYPKYGGQYLEYLFVFKGKVMDPSRFIAIIADSLTSGMIPLTFGQLRHVMKYMFNAALNMSSVTGASLGDVQVPSASRELALKIFINNAACKQMNHSVRTGSFHYANIEGQFPGFNEVEFAAQLNVSSLMWDMLLYGTQSSAIFGVDQNGEHMEISQCSCSKRIEFLEKKLSDIDSRIADALKSRSNEDGLLHEAIESGCDKMKISAGQDEADNESPRWVKEVGLLDLEKIVNMRVQPVEMLNEALVSLTGVEDAAWKSREQKEGVKYALGSSLDFICVLPTGGGKSLIFMLAAHVKASSLFLVLTPTTSLRDDLTRRVQEAGIQVTNEIDLDSHRSGILLMCFQVPECITRSSSHAQVALPEFLLTRLTA